MKFALELRTAKQRYMLFGLIVEFRQPAYEYIEPMTRTTVAIFRPHKIKEGIAIRLWGYDKKRPKQFKS